MSKKFFIIIGVVLIIVLLVLVGYYLFFQKNGDGTVGNVNKFRGFFPFGGPIVSTSTPQTEEEVPQPEQPKPNNFTKKLRKISSEPVAGAGIADFKAGSVVHHIEKATGHIYETELFSPVQNRISNTTIPMVYNAIWGNSNNSLIAQYLKEDNQTIDTYSLSLKTTSTTTENTISGIKFPENISEYSVFGTSVFYLSQNDDGSVGIISNFDGSKKKQVWDSPIKEFLPQYVNSSTVALTSKPYQGIAGFLYFISTDSGRFRKILGDTPGLSTLVSPDAAQVLMISQTNSIQMYLYTISKKTSVDTTPYTFPEKCVWSKKDKAVIYCAVPKETIGTDSLTSWYRGIIAFTDNIWKYDLNENTSSLIEDLSEDSKESIDVIKPILSDNGQFLIFINKIDDSLWSLDLTM